MNYETPQIVIFFIKRYQPRRCELNNGGNDNSITTACTICFVTTMLQYIHMNDKRNATKGWGVVTASGAEIWDAKPVFANKQITWKDKLKLIFYPKRFLLFRYIEKDFKKKCQEGSINIQNPYRILDVGCGTGSSVIDLKKMFGRQAEVIGIDVVGLQVDLAREKIKQHGVYAEASYFDGIQIPFSSRSFDAVYTSDVLGHVKDVRAWLSEISRVLKSNGILAMFTESKLGKHAYLRNYLMKRGLNTDPHQEFHISLYPKVVLKEFIESAGLEIVRMYTTVWAKFLIHPDELYPALQGQNKFFIFRKLNQFLYWLKKKAHPFSTAFCELFSLMEMLTVGRWVESQGYVVFGRKVKTNLDS